MPADGPDEFPAHEAALDQKPHTSQLDELSLLTSEISRCGMSMAVCRSVMRGWRPALRERPGKVSA